MATTVQSNTSNISQSLLNTVNGTKSTTTNVNATQDRFLKLLVEQLKNQDPLNPMDNAQVTSQMAQLSTVTGIDKLNDTMSNLMTSNATNQASGMIGHSVLVTGNKISTTGTGGYLGVDLATNVDKVNVAIKNSSGIVIKNIELGKQAAGVNTFKWDGLNNDGTAATAGDYTFEATSTVGSTTSKATALNLSAVISVSTSTTGVKLNLSNQASVSTSDVKEIY